MTNAKIALSSGIPKNGAGGSEAPLLKQKPPSPWSRKNPTNRTWPGVTHRQRTHANNQTWEAPKGGEGKGGKGGHAGDKKGGKTGR